MTQVVEDVPEIDKIAINPVMAREDGRGAVALDARIKLRRGEA